MAAAVAAPLIGTGTAEAASAPTGCRGTVAGGTVPGGELGHYPPQVGAQSTLRVACSFNNDPAASAVSGAFTVHDFDVAQYHNGGGRDIVTSAAVPAASPGFVVNDCTGLMAPSPAWVNRAIGNVNGQLGIKARTFVKSFTVTVAPACTVVLNQPTGVAMAAATVLKVDNSIARSITNDATITGPVPPTPISFAAASNTITSASLNFTAADVGLSVSGTEIPADTVITAVAAPNATISNNTLAPSNDGVAFPAAPITVITLGATLVTQSSTRSCSDGTTPGGAGTAALTAATCRFRLSDIGLRVQGGTLPATTFITAYPGAGAVVTITNSTGGAIAAQPANTRITVGAPTATAPKENDQVAFIGVQLDLSPLLIGGSEDCASESADGFSLAGVWRNPGFFTGSALFNTPPAGVKVIGQILFDNAATDFSAWIIEKPNAVNATRFLYDVQFVNLPVTNAMCPGTATSPGLGFSLGVQATTPGQSTLATGTGRPSTAQFRAVGLPPLQTSPPFPVACGVTPICSSQNGYTSTISMDAQPANPNWLASEFTRICGITANPTQVQFKCGHG